MTGILSFEERLALGNARYGEVKNAKCAICSKDFGSWGDYDKHRAEAHEHGNH